MKKIFGGIFGRAEKNNTEKGATILVDGKDYDVEYVKYCIEQEQTVSALEAYLHTCDDPKEIAMQTLKTANDFYEGDWAGILEVDLELGVWAPVWWYNPRSHDKTLQMVNEFEEAEYMPSWIAAMNHGEPLIVLDVDRLTEVEPKELTMYKRLQVKSVLAAPFAPNPMGFLVIRNPKRYVTRPSMLTVLAYVLHRAMAQQKTMESARMSLSPEAIQGDKDVIINFFGSMEICTSKGVLKEQDFNSPKSSRVATYLMLNRKSTHPPLEIAHALWPEDESEPETIMSYIRGHVYRFRKAFSLISEYQLIESTPSGYRINPNLRIMTDLQQFDMLYDSVQRTIAVAHKVELLKQAVSLYKGAIYENACDEHWIVSLVNNYKLRYIGICNELLATLAEAKDYSCLQQYANIAIHHTPENIKAYYWLIVAMYHLGAVEMARNELGRIQKDLTADEYAALIQYLKQDKGCAKDARLWEDTTG